MRNAMLGPKRIIRVHAGHSLARLAVAALLLAAVSEDLL